MEANAAKLVAGLAAEKHWEPASELALGHGHEAKLQVRQERRPRQRSQPRQGPKGNQAKDSKQITRAQVDKSHSKAKPASSRKATRSATAPSGKAVQPQKPRRKDESKTRHDKVPLQGPGNVKRTQSKAPTPVVSKQPKVEKVEARPATAQVDSSSSGESSSSEYTYVTTEEGVGENEAPHPAAPGAAAKAKPKAAPPAPAPAPVPAPAPAGQAAPSPSARFERNSRLLPKSSKLFANCRSPLRPINRSVCKLFVGVGQLAAQ